MLVHTKAHNSLIIIGTTLSAFSLGSLAVFTDPFTHGIFTHLIFFVSLFLVSVGVFTLLGQYIRNKLNRSIYVVNFYHSFRQALLLALFISGSLALSANGLLFWWVEGSLILLLLFIEIFYHV